MHQHARGQARGEFASRLSAQRLGVGDGPSAAMGKLSDPSVRSTSPRNRSRPLSIRACPAIGVRQEPSSSARYARSAASAHPVSEWAMAASASSAALSRSGQSARSHPGRGREKSLEVERPPGPVSETEALEPSHREQRRADRARFGLAQPRFDVSPKKFRPQVGTQAQELTLPAQRRGPEIAPCGRPSTVSAKAEISASRGSSRGRKPAIATPLGASAMAGPSPNERRRRSHPREGPRRSPW